jgi:hypothetical protein
VEHLGDEESGVLSTDERGYSKKDHQSLGIARQYIVQQATRSTARLGFLWLTSPSRAPMVPKTNSVGLGGRASSKR